MRTPMRFYWLYLAAWVRGWFYRWPKQAPIPDGYSGVSCGFRTFTEVAGMWPHGWEPWCSSEDAENYFFEAVMELLGPDVWTAYNKFLQ